MRKRVNENIGKYLSFYTKYNEIKNTYFSDMPIILLVSKKIYFNTNILDFFIPSVAIFLLYDFEDDMEQSNSDLSSMCPIT